MVALFWGVGCGDSSSSVAYGSITYEGHTCKTVVIGSSIWMAENLNYAVDSRWCYNNRADSCVKYGRLYQWASAMGIDPAYNYKVWGGSNTNRQGICPEGWHLPNDNEWQRGCWRQSQKYYVVAILITLVYRTKGLWYG